jgi:hypothetical protein
MSFRPAWYPDPTGAHDHRWWDGAEWTSHVADAGVAAREPIDASLQRAATPDPRPSSDDVRTTRVSPTRDRVGTASLILGLVALPVALLPFLGLVVAGVAVTLALIARRRAQAESRAVPGVTTGGLATGAGALALALIVSWSALSFLTSGDNLRAVTAIMRDYLVCVEDRPADECRSELEQALTALGEG